MLSIAQIIRNRISGLIPGDISKVFGTHEQVRFSFSLLSGLRMASMAGTHFYHANAWLGAWHTGHPMDVSRMSNSLCASRSA